MHGLIDYQSVLQLAAALNVVASAVVSILGDSHRREERIVQLLHDSADVMAQRAADLEDRAPQLIAEIAAVQSRIDDLGQVQDEEEARSGNLIGYGRPLFAGLSVASVGLLIVSSWPNGGGSMCAAYLASALLIPIVALSVWTAVKPDWLTAHLKGPRERVSIDLADIGDRVRQARSGRTTARVGTGNA